MKTEERKKKHYSIIRIALLGLGGIAAFACVLSCLLFFLGSAAEPNTARTPRPTSTATVLLTSTPTTRWLPTQSPTGTPTPTSTSTPVPSINAPQPTATSVPVALPTEPVVIPVPVIQPTQPPPTDPPPPICNCSDNSYNCADFLTHAKAQVCYDYCVSLGRGDVHALDHDKDGLACEALP